MYEKPIEVLKQIGQVYCENYLFFAQTLWPHRKGAPDHRYDAGSRRSAGALLARMHKAGLIDRLFDNNGYVYKPKKESQS